MSAPAPAGRPRAVVVTRRTELEELLERHATRGQAEFFLRTRGRDLARVQAAHDALADARRQVLASSSRGVLKSGPSIEALRTAALAATHEAATALR